MPPSDLDGLAFWWDNVVHLKAMLQTLGSGAFASAVSQMVGGGGDHWGREGGLGLSGQGVRCRLGAALMRWQRQRPTPQL